MLNPIPGTPLARNQRLTAEALCRITAVYRFLLPDASIRLAGGKRTIAGIKGGKLLPVRGQTLPSGDMLTTSGITVEKDLQMLKELGYQVRRDDE